MVGEYLCRGKTNTNITVAAIGDSSFVSSMDLFSFDKKEIVPIPKQFASWYTVFNHKIKYFTASNKSHFKIRSVLGRGQGTKTEEFLEKL